MRRIEVSTRRETAALVGTSQRLGRPDLFQLRKWETAIIPDGPSMGRTVVQPGGKKIKALDTVDKEAFYQYILEAWAR